MNESEDICRYLWREYGEESAFPEAIVTTTTIIRLDAHAAPSEERHDQVRERGCERRDTNESDTTESDAV